MSSLDSGLRSALIGHELVGAGPRHVVITNDWLCDTSTWNSARPLLDGARFTYAFVDLRGYGRSRGRVGAFTVEEAASDVIALAAALDWSEFSVVGHSMSALVALHLAQQPAGRIGRAVVIAPPPPTGLGADEAMIAASQAMALADDATRLRVFERWFGARLSPGWTRLKVERWRASADPAAAAAYVAMYARDGLPNPTAPISIPVLAIAGEQDLPPMRSEAIRQSLTRLCAELVVEPIANSGHYPMQETPPLTVALIERFLAG
jgi:3-oxoadipate enol-lactonase